MSVHIIFGYLIAIVAGIVALVKRPFKNRESTSLSFYNFIGTFNICISIVGAMFIYSDSGNLITGQLIIFLVTFVIGLFILESIYFDRTKSD